MAGYPTELFVEAPSTAILCKICREVAKRATSAPCCPEEVYCGDCLEKWLENKLKCPSDQVYLDHNMLKQRQDIDAQIELLQVECRNRDSGCRWQGPLKSGPSHREHCVYDTSESDVEDDCAFSAMGMPARTASPELLEPDFPSSFPAHKQPRSNFAGIMNQGATCYLNSLLQSLYMTPEFRNAVYRWDPASADVKEKDKDENIPFQLAKMFALLQTSKRSAVSSKSLTHSFGWDSGEAFEQHDVQELCRVLFDSLESYWRNSSLASVITDLYQGELKDFVKCKTCAYESARYDKYLDIPLVIKGFGATQAVQNIKEALENFTATEVLDGDNQYDCPRCQKKVDAEKGLKFCSFPYILSLQLKRFDFDYTTMRRIKLNDRVTFPDRIDLNGFVDKDDAHAKAALERYSSWSGNELPGSASGVPTAAQTAAVAAAAKTDAATADPAAAATAVRTSSSPNGPYVYELFSIMIQSGSALGGHYYAYIKNFDDGRWYDFDDSSVSEIPDSQIAQAYGGLTSVSSGYNNYTYAPSHTYMSSASAYMFFYRQVDLDRNEQFMGSDELPEHIRKIVMEEDERALAKLQKEEEERNTIRVDVFFHELRAPFQRHEKQIDVHMSKSLQELLIMAHEQYQLASIVPLERCRLRKYSPYRDTPLECFTGYEGRSLFDLGFRTYAHLLLETREDKEGFLEYDVNTMTIKAMVVEASRVSPARRIVVSKLASLADLKAALAPLVGVPAAHLRVMSVPYNSQRPELLLYDEFLLQQNYRIYANDDIFVECFSPEIERKTEELTAQMKRQLHVGAGHGNAVTFSDDSDDPLPPVTLDQEEGYMDSDSETEAQRRVWEASLTFEAISRHLNLIYIQIFLPGEEADMPNPRQWQVDQRELLSNFKDRVAELVHLDSAHFRLFTQALRHSTQLSELLHLTTSLRGNFVDNNSKIFVKIGQSLRPGEHRLELSLFCPDYTNVELGERNLFEDISSLIVRDGQSVREIKVQLQPLLREKGVEMTLDRMRLREKGHTGPGTVLLNHQCVKTDFTVRNGKTFCVEQLSNPESKTDPAQRVGVVRRWSPSTYKLGPYTEIATVEYATVSDLRAQIAKVSGVDPKHLEVAKVYGGFPDAEDVLEIKDLDWEHQEAKDEVFISAWPLYLSDGFCLFYRDKTEVEKQLTEEELSELKKRENARKRSYTTFSPLREKGVKIKTNESPGVALATQSATLPDHEASPDDGGIGTMGGDMGVPSNTTHRRGGGPT